MAKIVDLSKEQDLPGCVSAPLFLSELMRCLSEDVKKPAADMLQIFAEMAQYAAKKDDPALNVLCLRLGLFKMPPDKLKAALEGEMERVRKGEAPKKAAKDTMDKIVEIISEPVLERPDGTPCYCNPNVPNMMEDFGTSSEFGVCDGESKEVDNHSIAAALSAVARAQMLLGVVDYSRGADMRLTEAP